MVAEEVKESTKVLQHRMHSKMTNERQKHARMRAWEVALLAGASVF